MFIFWGSRNQQHKFGYAADFCPVCRKITPHQVRGISRVSHLYGIPMGSGQLLGHLGTCEICRTTTGVNPAVYHGFAGQAGCELEALIQLTYPTIRQQLAGRLAQVERLRSGALAPGEREALIMESFEIFAGLTEVNFSGSTEIRGRGGWGCLGTIVLCIAVAWAGSSLVNSDAEEGWVWKAVGMIALLGGVYSLVQLFLEPGRIFSRQILPNFAVALQPLQPTKDELGELLERFKKSGFKIGKKVRAESLWQAIEARRAGAGPPPLPKSAG